MDNATIFTPDQNALDTLGRVIDYSAGDYSRALESLMFATDLGAPWTPTLLWVEFQLRLLVSATTPESR